MPVMKGVEATRRMREESETCAVAMSAHSEGLRCKDYFRARKCFEYPLLSSDPEQRSYEH
jgi:CheY-like chemotaxis protein